MIRRIENRQLAHILAFFLITQFGGLFLASLIFTTSTAASITSGTVVNSVSQAFFYVIYIVITAVIILFVVKYYKGNLLFKLLEAFVVVFSSFFVFLILISYFIPNVSGNVATALSLLVSLALVVMKNKEPRLRNLIAILSSMGVGVVLGLSFSFIAAFALLGLVAVYDYVAVFVTKHMVSLAQALSSRNLAFLVGTYDFEALPKNYFGKREYASHLQEMKMIKNPVLEKLIKSGKMPVISQIQLGAGDLGLPLMLAVSAYGTFLNYFMSIVIIIGGTFGLIATMLFLRKYQRPLPAIPPLFGFICMAIGLGVLSIKPINLYLSLLFVAVGFMTIFFSMYVTLKMESENKIELRKIKSR